MWHGRHACGATHCKFSCSPRCQGSSRGAFWPLDSLPHSGYLAMGQSMCSTDVLHGQLAAAQNIWIQTQMHVWMRPQRLLSTTYPRVAVYSRQISHHLLGHHLVASLYNTIHYVHLLQDVEWTIYICVQNQPALMWLGPHKAVGTVFSSRHPT